MKKKYVWPELMECKCIKKEEKICFFSKNFNALCEIDLHTGTIEMCDSLSEEYFDEEFLVTSLETVANKLICVPYSAKKIHVIHLEKDSEQSTLGSKVLRRGHYYNAYCVDKYCYFFPFTGDEILKVDMEQEKIVCKSNTQQAFVKFKGENYSFFSNSECYVFKNKIYMVMYTTATIVEFDILSMHTNFYSFSGISSHYIHITGYKNNVYILGSDGMIYLWDIEKFQLMGVVSLSYNEEDVDRFKYSVRNGKFIYIFKYVSAKEFIRIDTDYNKAQVCSFNTVFNVGNLPDLKLNFMIMENGLFYFLLQNRVVYIIEFETRKINTVPLRINESNASAFFQSHESTLDEPLERVVQEGEGVWTLENYIIRHVKSSDTKIVENSEKIGTAIFRETK